MIDLLQLEIFLRNLISIVSEQYIKTLVEKTNSKLPLQGRNISLDRLYSSISIANWLLEKKITMIGTMMTNRHGIPDEIRMVRRGKVLAFPCITKQKKKDLALFSYVVITKSKGKKSVTSYHNETIL